MPHRLSKTSLMLFIVLLVWPILALLTQPEGAVTTQLFRLSTRFWPHTITFFVASLIAPLLLALIYQLVKSLDEPINRASLWLATLLYLIYLILATVSYLSQVFFKPLFMTPNTTMETLLNWYFFQETSLVGYINQSAYFAFAIATWILFIPLCLVKNPLLKSINQLLVISALFQITASLSHYFSVPMLQQLTLISGLLLIPVALLAFKYAKNLEVQT